MLIVGAGPSGLSAAFHLARMGHAIEVHEDGPLPCGMLHFGISAYRLPRNVLMQEIAAIEALGVKIVLNHKVEADLAAMRGMMSWKRSRDRSRDRGVYRRANYLRILERYSAA